MKTIYKEARSYYILIYLRLKTHPNLLIKNLARIAIPENLPHLLKLK